ncbi:glycoside hydrolase family 3 C-terminal domain-containing protein [Catenulispora subtropica]|uniref:Probable beta-glucosidase G n=1 Tax=Catenulispora subtropica TaxID=450798 RepID=A0ABN2SZX9_9ACTN
MRTRALLSAVALVAGSVATALVPSGAGPAHAASCPWVGSTAPVETRVGQVMAQITQSEEIALVHGVSGTYVGNVPADARLCIPALTLQDGPAGVGDGLNGVTQLPAPVAGAATWDTAAVRQYGTVLGAEQAGKGVNVELGPTINIVRDPRWGRAFESNGEDPYLAGSVGAASIQGIQSQGVLAQVKHLAVYNQETDRNTSSDDAVVAERTMQEIYLPQFQAAVKAGVASAMCSYSVVNGAYACDNGYLQETSFKSQFGFNGFITSDWGATHSTASSAMHGLDMEMPGASYFGSALDTAVTNGQVPKSRLDDMVKRILREMFAFGLFDRAATGSPGATVTTPAHAATAKSIAEEGSVLLKNNGALLPLSTSSTHSIAVIGDSAGTDAMSAGGGSAAVNAPYVVTPVQGITSRAGSGVDVTYTQGPAPNGALPTVPSSALSVTGSYYPNMTLSGSPTFTRSDSTIDFNWHGSSPGSGLGGTGWSAKWVGTIKAPTTGTYTFSLTSDDGSRMSVNGTQIIDNWSDHASSTATGTVSLTAGQATPIEVDYYQNGGLSNVTLGWQPPGDDPIADAADAARAADVAVVFASDFESEGSDLSSITLPGQQDQLISAVAAANPHTVVVLNTGSAVAMPWLNQVAGVVEAWYPGQEDGNAIAALLFGDVNPSGKLPVTFPASLADVPASTAAQWPGTGGTVQYSEGVKVGYRWYDAQNITPLFPFGFGLSYTTFGFSGLTVSAPDSSGDVAVSATVTNTGSVAGSDVAQLYVADPASTGEPPKQLKGFQRVTLDPGASTTVHFTVGTHDLAYWNETAHGWTTPAGTYGVLVGDSSRDLPLSGSVAVNTTTAPHTGPVVGIAGLCLDDKSASTANGNPITIYTCNGTNAQQVTVTSDHRLTVLGKCVDITSAGTANGTKVQLYDCNGTGAQIWEPQSDGALLNPLSGRCLDDPAGSTTPGTQLQIYDCNGTAAQSWRLP